MSRVLIDGGRGGSAPARHHYRRKVGQDVRNLALCGVSICIFLCVWYSRTLRQPQVLLCAITVTVLITAKTPELEGVEGIRDRPHIYGRDSL